MNITIDPKLIIQPEKAMKYWQSKVPTLRPQFNRLADDMKDRAFVISKLTRAAQVQQVYDGIYSGMSEGKPMQNVVNDLKQHGKIPLSTSHLRTVVNTNLKMAYAAGRWQEVQASKENRPYMKYLAVDDGRTRDAHAALNGNIYPVDDPFWKYNFPPNGFNCRCSAVTLSDRQLEKLGGQDKVINTKNPFPLNKDFSTIPGEPYKPDLSGYEPVVREQILNDMARHFGVDDAGQAQLKRYFNEGDVKDALILMRVGKFDQKAYEKLVRETTASGVAQGMIMPAGKIPAEVMYWMKQEGIKPRFSLITIDDKQLMHMQRGVKKATEKALSTDDVLKIPEILKNKSTAWYFDTNDPVLIAVKDGSKITIRLESSSGTPYVVTGGKVKQEDLNGYKKIK